MNHDPLCPVVNANVPFGLFHDDVPDDCLFCPLIARVREDERGIVEMLASLKRMAEGPERDHKVWVEAYAAALRDAVEAVLSMTPAAYLHIPKVGEQTLILLGDAVAAIEALGGER